MNNELIGLIPAAGVGARAAQPQASDAALPKQYRLVQGQPMLRQAVQALLRDPRVTRVVVAVAPDDTRAEAVLAGLARVQVVPCGGAERADTVLAALQAAGLHDQAWVLVHDAARPGLPAAALARLIDTCLAHDRPGLLALPVADTVKQAVPVPAGPASGAPATLAAAAKPAVSVTAPGGQLGLATATSSEGSPGLAKTASVAGGNADLADTLSAAGQTLDRRLLWLAQTPQMSRAGMLTQALLADRAAGVVPTDESAALERLGQQPLLVQGSARNIKVTWPADFELIEKLW